jgi:hypothetical protein
VTEKKTKPGKKSLGYIILYFYMILILLVLLTVASYTWFNISQTPRVSNMALYINAMAGMDFSVSPESDEWVKRISFNQLVVEDVVLRPATWSQEDQKFYGAVYGMDGRLTGKWVPLSDERNANRENYEGYYSIGTFYAHSDETVIVSLTPAVAVYEGGERGAGTYVIGTPVWNAKKLCHDNGGMGAEDAVRVGIRVYRLDENHQPTDEEPLFFIYEPNSDRHASAAEGYIPTPSKDGSESLIDQKNIITQTATFWEDRKPPLRNEQVYTFGEFVDNPKMFVIHEDEVVMIQLIIWLEGQDVDCTNGIANAKITANIQFKADSYHDSGVVGGDETEAETRGETTPAAPETGN